MSNPQGQIILFIDELHTLVGAGAAEGAIDASNMLKPALARGELRAIGATTLNEYRKYIEKDAALERRFQIVFVGEPNVEDTIAILRGLREKYEVHHGVRIKDSAIVAAATLSHRYISDRFLPDKAIDLIDEAAASLRIQIDSMPTEIDQLERRATQLEIERQALKREDDSNSRERLKALEKELAQIKEESNALKARWKQEKEIIANVRAKKEQLEKLKLDIQEATRKGEFERAAKLQYGELPKLEAEIKQLSAQMDTKQSRMLKEEVDEEDVAKIVSKWTGIPVSKMLEGEVQKLVTMEDRLRERVIGQDEALSRVANAIRRSRAGLERSEASDWFVHLPRSDGRRQDRAGAGAGGVPVRRRARHDPHRHVGVHGEALGIAPDRRASGLCRLRRGRAADRGSAAASVRRGAVRRNREGAPRRVQHLPADHGRRPPDRRQGPPCRFQEHHSHHDLEHRLGYLQQAGAAPDKQEEAHEQVMEALRAHFKPEFLNRVDDIIFFNPLGKEQLVKIVDLRLRDLQRLLADRKITLELTPKAKELIFTEGYDATYGARPLKRAIQRLVQDPLAMKILDGEVLHGDTVQVDVDAKSKKLKFEAMHREAPAEAVAAK